MAQDTKLGLVVGLGFIVCFATILANRGGVDRIRPQMPYQLFNKPASPNQNHAATVPEQHARETGSRAPRTPVAEQPLVPVEPVANRVDSPRRRDNALVPQPDVIADPDRFTRRRRPIPKPLELPEPVLANTAENDKENETGLLAEGASSLGGGLAARSQPRPAPATTHAGLPASLASFADEFERVTPGKHALRRQQPERTSDRRHVVEKGDSLTKIARRYYGSASKTIVDAIFEANRSVLPSPDTIIVGRTLRLPQLKGLASPANSPSTKPRLAVAEVVEPAPAGKPAYRWYKVKKGDVLGTIAQQQLGSSKRWKEILEVNKDICPDAQHLPFGAKIRIPIDTLADTR